MIQGHDDIFLPGSDDREKRLYRQWRAEYSFEKHLDDAGNDIPGLDDDSAEQEDRLRFLQAVSPFKGPLVPGEVRILSHRLVDNPGHLPYIALICPWEDDFWLMVPFSRFSVPALSGEMATGLSFSPLLVLQVWNARTAQACLLQQSWPANERLPEPVRVAADKLFRHLLGGVPLPQDVALSRGPALRNPFDLRQQYMIEERAQFNVLTARAAQLERWRAGMAVVSTGARKVSLAAADRSKDIMMTWQVPAKNAFMTLTVDASNGRMLVNICDEAGEVSQAVDECRLINGDGVILAVIAEGFAEMSIVDRVDRIGLIDADDLPLALVAEPTQAT